MTVDPINDPTNPRKEPTPREDQVNTAPAAPQASGGVHRMNGDEAIDQGRAVVRAMSALESKVRTLTEQLRVMTDRAPVRLWGLWCLGRQPGLTRSSKIGRKVIMSSGGVSGTPALPTHVPASLHELKIRMLLDPAVRADGSLIYELLGYYPHSGEVVVVNGEPWRVHAGMEYTEITWLELIRP